MTAPTMALLWADPPSTYGTIRAAVAVDHHAAYHYYLRDNNGWMLTHVCWSVSDTVTWYQSQHKVTPVAASTEVAAWLDAEVSALLGGAVTR